MLLSCVNNDNHGEMGWKIIYYRDIGWGIFPPKMAIINYRMTLKDGILVVCYEGKT